MQDLGPQELRLGVMCSGCLLHLSSAIAFTTAHFCTHDSDRSAHISKWLQRSAIARLAQLLFSIIFFSDGKPWHDAFGEDYDCLYYEFHGKCATWGALYAFQNLTANDVCCACAPTSAPTTASPTSPTSQPPSTLIPSTSPTSSTSQPSTLNPTTQVPTSSPTPKPTPTPTPNCVDKRLPDGQ